LSPTCEQFIRAVLAKNWYGAFANLNRLDMWEMLRGVAALDVLDRDDLWVHHLNIPLAVNMLRVDYAFRVVRDLRVPEPTPPGVRSGEVIEAWNFAKSPSPLAFIHDVTDTLPASLKAPSLTEEDYLSVARSTNAEVAAVKAVAQAETGEHGFDEKSNRPTIRYELHLFGELTQHLYDKTHPHLSQPTLEAGRKYHLDKRHAENQAIEWSLLYGAMLLRDHAGRRRTAEVWSTTSWGLFQVMGFSYHQAGWSSIDAFVKDMFISENKHLTAFAGFAKSTGLVDPLVKHDWTTFAKKYSGPGYRQSQYDTRIKDAYVLLQAQLTSGAARRG
jgi:N-acetylmuramidase-like protein